MTSPQVLLTHSLGGGAHGGRVGCNQGPFLWKQIFLCLWLDRPGWDIPIKMGTSPRFLATRRSAVHQNLTTPFTRPSRTTTICSAVCLTPRLDRARPSLLHEMGISPWGYLGT
ncbi:hypothetical protein T484DRAFT_1673969 [Baffinella frigidus]|nr:hypothetical protein T484DRAFT_1673969 [Cryptophyta sp. CCMP2293]